MEKRVVGNRRSEEELEQLKVDLNKLTFKLEEQPNFIGTKEQLEFMQAVERAYIDGDVKMSDEEWEILKRKHNYKESIASIAPSGRTWIKLFSPLPSIDKACNLEEIKNYFEKVKNIEGLNGEFRVECKLDGLTGNFRYKLDETYGYYDLESISSKGNGRYGLKLWPYALSGVKTNIPPEIHSEYIMKILNIENENDLPAYIELRGEAVIPKNNHTKDKYGDNAVLRSVASGIFSRKCPNNIVGALAYIYEEDPNIDFDALLEKYGEFDENLTDKRITLKGANARLIATLQPENNPDQDRFGRSDYLIISKEYSDQYSDYDIKVSIYHKVNGNIYEFSPDYEELDVVFYSMSIGDSNIDTDLIKTIPGIKYISDIEFDKKFMLDKMGIQKTYKITDNINQIYQAIFDFYGVDENCKRVLSKPRLRNMYEYALDGVVIKPVKSNRSTQGMFFRNHKNNANKIICPKYPEDQIAVKLMSEIVRVKLEKIEYSETELGNITCSGVLDKPYLTESGSMVERINLHNPEWLEANDWIKEGNEYEMILSMDIIPVLLNPNL